MSPSPMPPLPPPRPQANEAKANPRPVNLAPPQTRFAIIGDKGVFMGANCWSKDVKDSTAEVYPTFDQVRLKEHLKRLKAEAAARGESATFQSVPVVPDRGFNISVEKFDKDHETTVARFNDELDEETVEVPEEAATEKKPAKKSHGRKKKNEEESE